jgi:E3 ubiquitin-protein ligase makorin
MSEACKYFKYGMCSKKECDKSHDPDLFKQPLCKYYRDKGWCRFGVNCKNVHGNKCTGCNKHIIHPFNEQWAKSHYNKCKYIKEEENCGICWDSIYIKEDQEDFNNGDDNRLAVLESCVHVFCYTCIQSWKNSHPALGYTCPLCRQKSRFIVPINKMSERVLNKKELKKIVQVHIKKCSRIICKTYLSGCIENTKVYPNMIIRNFDIYRNKCRFGNECIYTHPSKSIQFYNNGHIVYETRRDPSILIIGTTIDIIDLDMVLD